MSLLASYKAVRVHVGTLLAARGAAWPDPACAGAVREMLAAARAFVADGWVPPAAGGGAKGKAGKGGLVKAAGRPGFRRPNARQPKIMVSKGDNKYQSTAPPWLGKK